MSVLCVVIVGACVGEDAGEVKDRTEAKCTLLRHFQIISILSTIIYMGWFV